MGGSRKQAELSLLAKVDQQTIERSIRHLRELQAANTAVIRTEDKHIDTLGEVNAETQRNINVVRQSIAAARQENLNRQQAIQGLDKEAVARREVAEAADRQANSAAKASRAGGRGSEGADFGRVSTGINSVAALLPGDSANAVRTLGDIAGAIDDLPRAVGEAAPALSALGGGITSLAAAGAAGIALAALAVAIQQFAKQISEAQERLDNAFASRLKTNELIQTATADEIQAQLKLLEGKRLAIQTTLDEAEAARAAAEAVGGFEGAVADLANFLGVTTSKDEKQAKEELERLNGEIEALRNAASSTEVQTRSAAKAAEEAAKAQTKQVQASQQATRAQERQVESAKQVAQASNLVADLYKSIVDRARAASEQLTKAEDQRLADLRDLRARYAQQEQDRLRQEAREQAREARRAAYDRARSEIEGRDEAFELAINRDFAGQARLGRQDAREQALQALDEQYNAQEKAIAEREAAEDRSLAYARELAAINQRSYETQRAASQTSLETARAAVAEWFKLKGFMGDVAHFTDELVMKIYRQIQAMAGVPGATFGGQGIKFNKGVPVKRASGGPLSAGQWSTVNELPGQRERFNGALLPAGPGLFMPLQSGYVGAGGGGMSVSMSVIVNGVRGNPNEIGEAVARAVDRKFRELTR